MKKATIEIEPFILRTIPVSDFEIARSGDGRTVTAYAATFDTEYPVSDNWGDYDESIHRHAWDDLGGVGRVSVLFNHGRTADGTPSGGNSRPCGTALEARPDGHGLLTVTRYAKTPLGEEVLELIKDGALRYQSFRGPVFSTAPPARSKSGRRLLVRMKMGLKEYGPCMSPSNDQAKILAVRSTDVIAQLDDLTDEQRAALAALLKSASTTPEPDDNATTPPAAPPVEALVPVLETPPEPGIDTVRELAEYAIAIRKRRNSH